MSRTSKDYQRELRECRTKTKNLESNIKSRLIKMIEKFPDSVILKKDSDTFYCHHVTKEWLDNQSVDSMLEYMRNIEQFNSSLQSNVQLELDL